MKKPPPRPIPPARRASPAPRLIPEQRVNPAGESPLVPDTEPPVRRFVGQRDPFGGLAPTQPARVQSDTDEGDLDADPDDTEPVDLQPLDETFQRWQRLGLMAVLVALVLSLSGTVLLVGLELRRSPYDTGTDRDFRFIYARPPAAAPLRGSYLSSRVLDDGKVRVTQWIRGPEPMVGIDLAMPTLPGAAIRRRALGVVVVADHVQVKGATTVGPAPRRYNFIGAVTSIQLRYTMEGVVDRSPSAPGRALVVITSLTTSLITSNGVDAGPTRVDLGGAEVLSASCLGPGAPPPRPCGAPRPGGKGWRVMLRGASRSDLVQAQVNLD